MDRLGQLQMFAAILETGSLAAAARRLGRSAPAVTRDLADLERRVGATLIERSTRMCRPTPAGRRLAEDARRLLDDYNVVIGLPAATQMATEGRIRVTAPTDFGAAHVAPLLLRFLDAHAGVSIDLHLLDRIVDLVEEDYDLAVRIGHPRDSALLMRPLGHLRRLFVASPAYLDAHGVPRTMADLRGHQIIQHSDRGNDAPWTFGGVARSGRMVSLTGRFAVNRPEPAVSAARFGYGIVAVLSSQVAEDLRSGTLRTVLEDHAPDPLPVAILYPPSRRGWRRVSLLVEYLNEGLASSAMLER